MTKRKANELALQKANENHKCIRTSICGPSRFFRHVMKRDKLKNLVTTHALEKKAKGSQAYKERFDQMLLLR